MRPTNRHSPQPRAARAVLLLALALATPAAAQEAPGLDIEGVVLDVATGQGIPDAILRLTGTRVSAASDADGRFLLGDVPVGTWTLTVDHVAYGAYRHEIVVEGTGTVTIEVRLDQEAIELTPLVVEATTMAEERRRGRGSSFWEVTRPEIERAMGRSRHMGDLVAQTVPGIKLRQSNNLSQTDICLEFRAAATLSIVNSRPCNHPQVYLDGVPVTNPQYLYGSVGLHNLERIEVIPPGEAGARYGSGSLYGVLLIETRRPGGVRATQGPGAPMELERPGARTFDWQTDPAGHRTGRTLLGAALGNAAGLGLGLLLARECIMVTPTDEIETACGGAATVAAGASAVILPAVGSALGARLAGDTGASVGRLVPALVGAGMMLFPGYAFSMSTVGGDVEAVNKIGNVFLAVGVPVAVTIADRLFRSLR